MDNRNGVPRRRPVPQQSQQQQQQPLAPTWASDLTAQFRRTLSTKRMNELSRRPASQRRAPSALATDFFVDRSPAPQLPPHHGYDAATQAPSAPSRQAPPVPGQVPMTPPPSYNSSIKNIPIIPTAPTDSRSLRFRSMLMSLSNTPCKWENPGLLDEALGAIPLQRIYDAAQEESDLFEAEAASLGKKPAWGYQDCVIRALLKWFRREFFTWVNNPKCTACHAPTVAKGMAAPLSDESARGASRVELYQCSNQYCQSYERFPRYNDAFVLLQTRRGRVGEWANCFTMLCRAIGSRVRWVWNAEDHVWTEVYSVHRKRWVHVDCCEESWDAPLLYTQGWQKKLSYCIAFSADGCADVTRRYVRDSSRAARRNKCSEGDLIHMLREIKAMRRKDMDKKEKFRLMSEDTREDEEFRRNVIESLAYTISKILPGGDASSKGSSQRSDPDAQKAAEARQEAELLRAHGVRGAPNQRQH
ncbi:hypothetical protein Q7P37_006773 [Cladosporium fusiforme]